MNVDPRVALGITLVFTVSPSTVLYENLLFYEHPLTALLCIGALFLHRYASAGRIPDGLVFFSSLALLAGIRSIYHLAWFAVIAVFAGLALRQWRRQTMLAAAAPTLLLVSFYAKHFILFHNLMPGGAIYGGINLSIMTTWALPPGQLDRLSASGKISVLKTDIYHFVRDVRTDVGDSPLLSNSPQNGACPGQDRSNYLGVSRPGAALCGLLRIVPVPPKTGIAVRDACLKSTRRFNWNCVWAADVSKLYTRDSLLVLRAFPEAYLQSVWANVLQYFMPDTEGWPLDGRTQDANEQVLSRPLAVYNLVTSGRWPGGGNQPWLFYVTLPGLMGMGVFKLVRGRRQIHDPALLTLAFMVFNIVYLTVVVVVFSESDQNRYRTELSPFFAVLLGMLATSVMKSRNRAASTARTERPHGAKTGYAL
jgi:hypothetical protein